jgi:hypothetical protein
MLAYRYVCSLPGLLLYLLKQWQQFRELSGEKEFLTRAEFRDTVRRNFGMMKEEWVKKYFRAFDRNDSGTIDFVEYVMGFAGMARVSYRFKSTNSNHKI